MPEVAAIRERLGPRTRIWVGHHAYRSNRDEIPEVARACAELGLEHRPIETFYVPLERLIDVVEGRANPRDSGVVGDLLTHPAPRRRPAPPSATAISASTRPSSTGTALSRWTAGSGTPGTGSASPSSTRTMR